MANDEPFATFGIFSSEDGAFNAQETELLRELAENLSLGITTIRRRVDHEQMVRLLREEVEQEERKRLSALLHDGVGQSVQAVNLGLKRLRALASEDGALQVEILDRILAEIKEILGDLRDLTQELRPLFLERKSLREAIQYHCSELQRRTNTSIHFAYSPEQPMVTERVKTQCFLCLREAVNNVLTHAKASRIDVDLDASADDTLRLRISDNGIGFCLDEAVQTPSGLGLAMMRERAEGIGGRVEVVSAPDQGSTVVLVVPLTPDTLSLDTSGRRSRSRSSASKRIADISS